MPWRYEKGDNYVQETYATFPLYFGFELELVAPSNRAVHQLIESARMDFQAGGDYSIQCPANYDDVELRLHPRTWNWLIQNRQRINKMIRNLRHLGALSGTEYNCGMHVHFSRVLTEPHLLSVLQLVYANPADVERFSLREEDTLHEYARLHKLIQPALEKPRQYCTCATCQALYEKQLAAYNKHAKQPAMSDREMVTNSYRAERYHHKFSAVHICTNTVEIRIFNGTMNSAQLWANLELCRSMVEYTAQPDYDWNTQSSWALFHQWVKQQKAFTRLKRALGVTNVQQS